MATYTLPRDNPVVVAGTKFTLDMMRKMTAKSNFFFSPFSISTALSMTSLGARGKTADEMRTGLGFVSSQSPDDLHSHFNGVISTINAPGNAYNLSTANRIYTRQGKPFNDDFLLATRKHYVAEAKPVDFQGNPVGVKNEINTWVEEQTAGKIKDLIPDISPDMAMILVNAIYFKANWAEKFDPAKTRQKPFSVSKENTVETDFMYISQDFQIGQNEELGCRMLMMPYEQNHLSFCVILPNEVDGLEKLETSLTADHLLDLPSTFMTVKTEVNVFLPKFKMEQELGLKEILCQLGMPTMFVRGEADFSAMDGTRDMYVDAVIHKAYVDVNEEGTEAAAATAVMMRGCCLMRPQTFVADKPFLFLIRDNRNGAILFMGRYCTPPQ